MLIEMESLTKSKCKNVLQIDYNKMSKRLLIIMFCKSDNKQSVD